jgi:hypothetical protein
VVRLAAAALPLAEPSAAITDGSAALVIISRSVTLVVTLMEAQ